MAKRKRKKHTFLKVLLVLVLAGLCVGLYAWFYPGSPFGKATYKAKNKAVDKLQEAKPVIDGWIDDVKQAVKEKTDRSGGRLTSTADIDLRRDGGKYEYVFTYNGEDYRAVYITDTWKIYDSYKITNRDDMKIICQALSDVYPVPSRDGKSYRTADDMAYEWDQHNKIYRLAPEGSRTKERTRNVDLDPEDQGKSYKDLYQENLAK